MAFSSAVSTSITTTYLNTSKSNFFWPSNENRKNQRKYEDVLEKPEFNSLYQKKSHLCEKEKVTTAVSKLRKQAQLFLFFNLKYEAYFPDFI